ncbi:MBL fold metallo-hydrolase [Streptomyces sp. WAC04114]|uniref:MBL fold metallo-hydrolase n=1 Tax=Streptomyces sp. WAC04114 TaxID=2867961 RepID=UPI0035AB6EF0
MLLSYGPLTLLTDPNFLHRGQYAYLGHGLLGRRLTEPALDVHELPRLDGIVLSHLHGDHWDRRARRHLDHTVPILATPHAARCLRAVHGFHRTAGLHTWKALRSPSSTRARR